MRQRHPDQPIFRRQHPFGPYVLDFYCAKARLAVEIDGWGHLAEDRPRRDELRDAWLAAHGVATLRLGADAVMRDFDATLEGIVETAREMSRKVARS